MGNFLIKNFAVLLFIPFLLSIVCCIDNLCENEEDNVYIKNTDWTMMHYCAGDSNGLASDLCDDIEEVIKGYNDNCNVLVLIDVSAGGQCTIYNQTFSGTGVFRVEKNKLIRIEMRDIYKYSSRVLDNPHIYCKTVYEDSIDTGDTDWLQAFITYCKENYPAKYYGLFLGGHGNGVGSTVYSDIVQKNILYDGGTKRMICAVDLTTNLNKNCSVDFLDLDLCYMACVEFLYQIRKGNGSFSADYVVASAPEVWGMGQNYSNIYKEFTSDITPEKLARLILKLQDEYTQYSGDWHSLKSKQSLIACDLSKISNVKQKFDNLCSALMNKKELAESIRGFGNVSINKMTHYFPSSSSPNWRAFPYFDLYDFVFQIGEKDQELKSLSDEVCTAIEEMILESFGRSYYSRFQPGKMGLSFFYPDFSRDGCSWDYMIWNEVSSSKNECYGSLAWCKDDVTTGNWFSLLEYWYKD